MRNFKNSEPYVNNNLIKLVKKKIKIRNSASL